MKQILTTLLTIMLITSPQQLQPQIRSSTSEEQIIDKLPFDSIEAIYETTRMVVCSHSSVKTYMDWLKTSPTSRQGKFMREHMTVKEGLLYSNDGFIGVALGSYFGVIGDKFVFTLDTGIVLRLIKIEEKSDRHVTNGCEHKLDHSVIEFVIDLKTNKFFIASNGLVAQGNFNNLPQFKGKIVGVEKVN